VDDAHVYTILYLYLFLFLLNFGFLYFWTLRLILFVWFEGKHRAHTHASSVVVVVFDIRSISSTQLHVSTHQCTKLVAFQTETENLSFGEYHTQNFRILPNTHQEPSNFEVVAHSSVVCGHIAYLHFSFSSTPPSEKLRSQTLSIPSPWISWELL
jgi:hypothetical protein